MGYDERDWKGKPVIAILNTWSDINPCHAHFKHRVEDVKRGVFQAGGFPIELPALSLSENFVKPTTMLYRNLLAMEAEELIRSHPVDAAVLMGGCDKTTPGLVMGALSAGLPMIFLPAGPMLRGNYRGQALGSGSDAWKYWDDRRAGMVTDEEWSAVEAGIEFRWRRFSPQPMPGVRRIHPQNPQEETMANEGFHESVEDLSDETRDMHRAITSLMEELEAVDWYNQRVDACKDSDLRAILAHNRDEE
jgi:dihydroxy-acid dehydratase